MNTVGYDKSIATRANLQLIFDIFNDVAWFDNPVDGYNSVQGTSMASLLQRSVLIQLDMTA